jgi:hypothetical protein
MEQLAMTTRRSLLLEVAMAASFVTPIKLTWAQVSPESFGVADFLVVQNSKAMTFDNVGKRLTLTGVAPVILFFIDRPERIAGTMKTAAFTLFWSEGRNSSRSNPSNAEISLAEGAAPAQIVAALEDPVLSGDNLSYKVNVLRGEMPARAQDVSLFIDIIGHPLTRLSFAGTALRSYRRAYWKPQ